jgi:integrase
MAHLSVFDRAFWGLAFLAGLRVGEIQGLRWHDLDLASSVVIVGSAWDAEANETVDPKSASGTRRIPLPFELRELLIEHRAAAAGKGYVFPGRRADRPVAASTVHRRGRRAARAAGVPWTPPHGARKSYSSWLHAAEVGDKAQQTFMGHSSIVTTMDIYTDLLPGAELAAIRKLERFLAADR